MQYPPQSVSEEKVERSFLCLVQVPDRLCVTAPSGDRSRSYIHPKTQGGSGPRAAEVLQTAEQVLLSNITLKRQLPVTLY